MKRKLVITVLMILLHSQVQACDCDHERRPVKQLLKESKTVFVGTVISSRSTNFRDSAIGVTFQEIVLRVDNTLAGDSVKKEITVFTEHTDCGQYLHVGKKYLVYAYLDTRNNFLRMNQCFSPCPEINTTLAKQDLEEIKKMNPN